MRGRDYMLKNLSFLIVSSNIALADSQICLKYYNINLLKDLDSLNSKRSVIISDEDFRSNRASEVLIIHDGKSQRPEIHVIESRSLTNFYYLNDYLGDHINVSLLLPKMRENVGSQKNLHIASSKSEESIRALGQKDRKDIAIGTKISELSKLGKDERRDLLSRYFHEEVSTSQMPLDPKAIKFLVDSLINDKETLQRALDFHNRHHQSQMGKTFYSDFHEHKLANEGQFRYFKFTPKESKIAVNARVLDIHRWNSHPENMTPAQSRGGSTFSGVSILVEWLDGLDESGLQKKHIAYLKQEEMGTIEIIKDEDRLIIQETFSDTLNLLEIQTKKLAEALKLRTFGFTDKGRVPGLNVNDGMDPLTLMSNISHLAMKGWNSDRFGNVLARIINLLSTKEEREHPLFNIIDLMGKLNPRFVLEKFKTAPNSWEYIFVITEDGSLKVSLHGHSGNNLKAQNLRLAGGKRVLAAGKFKINEKGKLIINLKSDSYQDINAAYGSYDAFRASGSENLDFFIVQAFLIQAGKEVENINNNSTQSYYEYNFFEQRARENRETKSTFGQRERDGFGEKESYKSSSDFEYMKHKYNSRNANSKELKWNPDAENSAPLEFEKWSSEMNSNEKIDWAHYVLGTNPDMPIGKIKNKYRKLINKFHQDKNSSVLAKSISSSLNVAWEILEEKMRD